MKRLLKNLLWLPALSASVNSTGRASAQPNAPSITVNLTGGPAAPVSFIVRVSAETSPGSQFQVNKRGEF